MLVCYHDYTSPGSAAAVLRLQRLSREGLTFAFTGVEILGLTVAIPPSLDLLAALEHETERARSEGLELRRPSRQPPTAPAHLIGDLATGAGLGAAWREACYRAYWERDADIGSETVLTALAAEVGLDTDEVASALADPLRIIEIRRRMAGYRGEGIGGVPILDAGGTYVSPFIDEADLRQLATLM